MARLPKPLQSVHLELPHAFAGDPKKLTDLRQAVLGLEPDAETLRDLKALGYVGGDGSRPPERGQ